MDFDFEQERINAAKTTTERVDKLRADRGAQGLKRRELYATADEWKQIQALLAKLQRKREREAKKAKE